MTSPQPESTSIPVMQTVLRLSLGLTVAVAVIGGIIGWFVAEWAGVWSALIAALVVLMFTAVTAISVIFAARFDTSFFMAIILGAWIVKLVAFIAILLIVRALGITHDWMLWWTMLIALIGQLAVDVIVVLRSRQGYASDVPLPGPEKTDD